jgi:hypothetical protein
MSANQAIRDHLAAQFSALPYLETTNANPQSRPATGFCSIEFSGGTEEMASVGYAGANRYRRQADAVLSLFFPAGTSPADAESVAVAAAAVFRGQKITTSDSPPRVIHIYGVDPPYFVGVDGRFFGVTIAFRFWYDVFG